MLQPRRNRRQLRAQVEGPADLAEQCTQPYASTKRVFWIIVNGSAHRGQTAIDRLTKRFPNAP